MLYIQDVRPGRLVLSSDPAGEHSVALNVLEVGMILSVLEQARREVSLPGFKLVHNEYDSNDEYDYTCVLDHEQCGFSGTEARVLRHALCSACLKLCRTKE